MQKYLKGWDLSIKPQKPIKTDELLTTVHLWSVAHVTFVCTIYVILHGFFEFVDFVLVIPTKQETQ